MCNFIYARISRRSANSHAPRPVPCGIKCIENGSTHQACSSRRCFHTSRKPFPAPNVHPNRLHGTKAPYAGEDASDLHDLKRKRCASNHQSVTALPTTRFPNETIIQKASSTNLGSGARS